MGSGIRGSERRQMGLCTAAERSVLWRMADSRRDDRQRQAPRCVHRLCRERQLEGALPPPRVRDGASVPLSLPASS